MNAIYERTSVRQFTNQTLTQEQVNAILKAGFFAPSARNLQPWYFVVIEKESLIRQLQEFSPYASPLQTATLAIVVCADLSINPSTDYCQQDCAAATQNMLVQAKEFTNLKGLLYFTDGFGRFPAKQPGYLSAFVFLNDELADPKVPVWAIKLVLQSDEI